MATHPSILAWKISRRVYQAVVHGVTKNWTQLSTHTNIHSQTLHKKYVWYKNVNYTSVRKKSGYQKPSL